MEVVGCANCHSYRRHELVTRVGIYASVASVAGGFGGGYPSAVLRLLAKNSQVSWLLDSPKSLSGEWSIPGATSSSSKEH